MKHTIFNMIDCSISYLKLKIDMKLNRRRFKTLQYTDKEKEIVKKYALEFVSSGKYIDKLGHPGGKVLVALRDYRMYDVAATFYRLRR